jgi:hypothetical protein
MACGLSREGMMREELRVSVCVLTEFTFKAIVADEDVVTFSLSDVAVIAFSWVGMKC